MQPSEPPLNEKIFEDLIAMAGPETAPQLLQQILEDLDQVAGNLRNALDQEDAKQLREQGHTLTSLAGTLGATDMQSRAQELNANARSADFGAAQQMARTLLRDIAALHEGVAARASALSDPDARRGQA